MKICMLVYFYWPEKAGGAENQCRKQARALVEKGHEVTVVTARVHAGLSAIEQDHNCTIIRLPVFSLFLQPIKKILSRESETKHHSRKTGVQGPVSISTGNNRGAVYRSVSRTVAWIERYFNILVFNYNLFSFIRRQRNQLSILHVHTADWIAGVAARVGSRYNVPVVCKGADTPVFPPLAGVPLPRLVDRWRKQPGFIALTNAMKEDLVRNDVCGEQVTVIPNGVELPQRCAEPGTTSTFLFLGNFSQTAAHKGFDILIDAWEMVVAREPQARLTLVGGGDSSVWRSLAAEKGIGKTLSFPGYCNDIETFFLESCCLILPSRKEGISNALLEAQSYGLPAIVSDIPGNREVVGNGMNGIVVPVGDRVALSRAILTLYRDPDVRETYGKAARKRIEDRFSINGVVNRIERLYKNMVEAAGS